MKKIRPTRQWVKILRTRKPNPFPGPYPTRWHITVMRSCRKDAKCVFYYFGKPNKGVAQTLISYVSKQGYSIVIEEGDRSGAIWNCVCFGPTTVEGLRIQDWNEALARFYYPWDYAGIRIVSMWLKPVFRFRVVTPTLKTVVYSSVRPNLEDQRQHKTWLAKTKFT